MSDHHQKHYHVEVHNRHNEVEHFVCLCCESERDAQERVLDYYRDKGISSIAPWAIARDHPEISHYVFRVEELEDKPVVYIAGEYRSQYPI